jgi:hypothetical protein
MYGATWTDIIIVLFLCLLPAAAVLLCIFASILAFIPITRIFSLALALLCLIIYAVVAMLIIGMRSQQFTQELDSLPAGRLFHSLIPLMLAVAVIGFDIYALIKSRRKDR